MKKSTKNQSPAATADALAKAAGKSGGALTEGDLNKVTKNHKNEIE